MTTPSVSPTPADPVGAPVEATYSRVRLTLGVLGRMWLWFLAACLAVTLVPLLFGWHPYLIESGSMEPHIDVGDVVLVSPYEGTAAGLVGHVVAVDDPGWNDRVKTHRVVSVDDNGLLVTKGDANPSDDTAHVPMSSVRGIGRLLVMWVGLPVIWFRTGEWLWLLLFLGTVGAALWASIKDHEAEEQEEGADPDRDDDPGLPGSPAVSAPGAGGSRKSGFDIAATRPTPLVRGWRPRRWALRIGYGMALAAAIVLPTATAAFSATTRNTGNSWSVPHYSYTTAVTDLGPYLYWKLDETGTGTAAADSSGTTPNRPGEYSANGGTTYFTKGVTGGLVTDSPNNAVTLTNASSCVNSAASVAAAAAPSSFTIVAWFKAPVGYSKGGKLIGFEKPRTGVAAPSTGQYDRMLYLDGDARVRFGVYNDGYDVVSTTGGYADNAWHMAVGTMGASGMALYVDGVLVGTDTNNAAEANTAGWWRAGCGNLAGWRGAAIWSGPSRPPADTSPTNYTFQGGLDEVTVWTKALTASQISFLYFSR